MKSMLVVTLGFSILNLTAGETVREINLSGTWKFILGDKMAYAEKNWDDSDWKSVQVPDKWENQGYRDYDGYAWYRNKVKIPASLKSKGILLRLGKIDDVDRVYFNGVFLQGRGGFPPTFSTAYNWDRQYLIPPSMIEFARENTIAVRVYDEWGDGGIVSGPVGIDTQLLIELAIDLSGLWSFIPGDDAAYKNPDIDVQRWESIRVPGAWESQTHEDLDGFAWYRKTEVIPDRFKNDKLVLVLGRIDDSDEVFVNGTRIARTGTFPDGGQASYPDAWQKERFYYIPLHIIRWNGNNVIAVRVYDIQQTGGIYEGPVGVATQKAFLKYKGQ
jgi:hypothetical protein